MTPDNSHFWIEEFYFTLASRDDILEGKRLDDPAQSGLRDSLVLEATNRWYYKPQKLVQIILTDNWSHWVCISNTISENDIVEIFDTAPPKQLDITSHIQRQIAGIMKSTGNSIEVPLHIRAYYILNIYISHIICNYTYEHTCICTVYIHMYIHITHIIFYTDMLMYKGCLGSRLWTICNSNGTHLVHG